MRLRDPHAELRAVASVLDGPSEVSIKLLGILRESHFGYPPTHEIFVAIRRHLAKRGDAQRLPSTRAFRYTPGLSDEARELLAKQPKPIRHGVDVDPLFQSLELHRQLRVLHGFMSTTTKKLAGETKHLNLTQVREEMVSAVERLTLRDESEVFTHLPGEDAKRAVKEALTNVELLPSPFKNFNDMAGGFALGDLHLLASHRAGGKSAMANCLADFFCQKCQLPTAYVQLEMSRATQVRRLLAKRARVKHSVLRDRLKRKTLSTDEKAKLLAAYKDLRHGRQDGGTYDIITPGNIGALELELLLRPYNYRVVLIDQLTTMDLNAGDTEASQLSNTAKAVKQLARRLNAAVFLLVQLDMKEDQIRYSRGIEEHADLVWTWRWGEDERKGETTEVKQPKTRHFEEFSFTLKPILDYMDFEDATSEDQVLMNEQDRNQIKQTMKDM